MKKILALALALVLVLSLTAGALAANFPTKNITIVVPYDAGGGVDITTRVLTEAAGKDYFNGKSLIVENRGGGGAVIGHTYVANSKADGYTLLAYTSAVVNNPQLKEVTYTHNSFKTLGMVCFDPEIIVVPAASPFQTLQDLIDYAKENKVIAATPGNSTAHHIAAIRLSNEFGGLQFEYLHENSAAMQTTDLLGGHCDVAFMAASETFDNVLNGSIRALAIGSEERIEVVPDVPTMKECGSALVVGAFRGYACPAGVPDDVYQYLVEEFDKIITSEKFINSMNEKNIPYAYMSAADFQAYADAESAALAEIVPMLKGE
ncbi:MAG: tripartite tricarboxylate transporter substrate binding protein [Clostridia bacterium]|nr:tripartite tricarboxylate transporter substrate binding protein [Clostridia bacterium]